MLIDKLNPVLINLNINSWNANTTVVKHCGEARENCK